ncbi:MAG: metal-sensitive transcriptional regulator [Propionibacterium sp.]|nr:metal-sensitive transcriptional regulator [Propionibacterium sp.]
MQLTSEQMVPVLNRLKRARGQLSGVITMIEEGRECEDIVTQLAAVGKALDRAGYSIIAEGLRQCMVESDGETDSLDAKKLERVFLSMA